MPLPADVKPSMAGRRRGAVVYFFALALAVLAGDLALKWWSFNNVAGQPVIIPRDTSTHAGLIPPHQGIRVVPGVLSLKLTLNQGAVFGLGAGGRWFFVLVTLIAVVVITMMFWRSPPDRRWLHTALALILAGALGNLYDRLVHGVVRDMLYLFPGATLPFGWEWPNGSGEVYPWIFNLADVALVGGVLMILLTLFKKEHA
jgi:signal peptidase II